jgi:hypothetical protein
MNNCISEKEIFIGHYTLSRYCKTTTQKEIIGAYDIIRDSIYNSMKLGVKDKDNWSSIALWSAIYSECHLELIQKIYELQKDTCKFKWTTYIYSDYETRGIKIESYTLEHHLSYKFGPLFRNMKRCTPEDIEYIEGILGILQIKEEDIDWDLTLKSGYHD